MKRFLFALALLTVVSGKAESPAARFGRLTAGSPAPDFTAIGADGKEVKLSGFRDRTVVLNFWSPNRGPGEALQAAFLKYGALNMVVIGVCSFATRAEFDAWVEKTKGSVTYPLVWDPAGKTNNAGIAQKNFGVGVYPATGVIDRSGKIVGGFVGFGAQSGAVLREYLRGAGLAVALEEGAAPPVDPSVPELDETALKPGRVAPDFTTVDIAGRPRKLSEYAGKIIVLDFWATWCAPCIESLPHTQKVAAAVKAQGVVVLASCTNDTREEFEAWMKKNAASYPDLVFSHDAAGEGLDRASVKLYGEGGVPTQFVIGRDGKVTEVIPGYGEGDTRLEEALAKLGIDIESTTAPSAGVQPKRP